MFSSNISMRAFNALALAISLINLCGAHPTKTDQLPIVDLGYELHQAASFNETGGFYNFSNIRYAAPPIGNLRFAAPIPPAVDRSVVQTGSVGRICPQSAPAWEATALVAVEDYLLGIPFNATLSSGNATGGGASLFSDPRTTEDCLFLDVYAPKRVLDEAGKCTPAAVLVWIYGGGYTDGEKSEADFNPAGLLAASGLVGDVVFVAMNYRLGAFGWLSGPNFQAEGGVANAGLLDQRLALEWVQEHIHHFGGDKNRVTVLGESAGGGSIEHQITAYGGKKGCAPFQQAILQSPGFVPTTSKTFMDQTFAKFLKLTNTTSLAELRAAPAEVLIYANILQVGASPYGTFTYGPVVDGVFAPALPGELLARGHFDRDVRIMTGHNANEGLYFASPYILTQAEFDAELQSTFPDITPAAVTYVSEVLYPPVFNGSYGYMDYRQRVAISSAESSFTCNNVYLAHAVANQSYAYEFLIPPALHGQDVPYTFYTGGPPSESVSNTTVALALQDAIVTFTVEGKPRGFGVYGDGASVLRLSNEGITVGPDDIVAERCSYWQFGSWRF